MLPRPAADPVPGAPHVGALQPQRHRGREGLQDEARQVSCDWWTGGHVTTLLTSDWPGPGAAVRPVQGLGGQRAPARTPQAQRQQLQVDKGASGFWSSSESESSPFFAQILPLLMPSYAKKCYLTTSSYIHINRVD